MAKFRDFLVQVGFFDHLKTKRIEARHGLVGVLGILRVWEYTTMNHPNGELGKLSQEDLGLIARVPGDPSVFGWDLVAGGFIDMRDDGTCAVHDWLENQPTIKANLSRSEKAQVRSPEKYSDRTRETPGSHSAVTPETLDSDSRQNGQTLSSVLACQPASQPASQSSHEESPLTPQGEDLDFEEIDPNEPEWMRSEPPASKPPPAKVEPPAPAPSTQQPGGEEPSPDKPEVVASPTAATQEVQEVLDEWNRIARIHGMPVSRDCKGRREEITKALRRPETRERWRELFSIIDQEGGTPPGWTNALNLTTVLRPVSLPKILDRQWWARGKPRADQMGSIQVAQKIGKVFDEYKAREQQRETQEHERRLELTDGNE